MRSYPLLILFLFIMIACNTPEKSIGSVERIDPALDAIVTADAQIDILGEGFEWSEGPLWVADQNMLIFSDVPKNIIYKWTQEKGVEPYLRPSGFTGTSTESKEPGSNGLLFDDEGNLVLCQHGDRRLAVMNSAIDTPKAEYTTIADRYQGRRFSSPNDAVFYNYSFYFTDPPYGLPKQADDPTKEIPFNGVYVVPAEGDIKVIVDSLTRPNGLAFLPNQKTLIVANSDPAKARWYAFDLNEKDSVTNARILYDATENTKTEKGLPDGLKVDSNGNIFATGPGGIWIFNSAGKLLGKIKITEATSNCALADDGKTLYVTADMYLVRIRLRN
ncbi:MAG TPA: SMP-30/gluconolactonase/LRE family protein [Cyclobacteriaceae bacterium]|nr:SMP-30/gluconolactonase/LRE family protein [Cyclobacteriaceae bacterium]